MLSSFIAVKLDTLAWFLHRLPIGNSPSEASEGVAVLKTLYLPRPRDCLWATSGVCFGGATSLAARPLETPA
jgi:hypothetical protein